MLRNAGDNDRRSKRFCSNEGALPKFHVTDGHNMGDQIAFYAFHLFLVEVQTKAGYIHATNAQ